MRFRCTGSTQYANNQTEYTLQAVNPVAGKPEDEKWSPLVPGEVIKITSEKVKFEPDGLYDIEFSARLQEAAPPSEA